jgi:hypothetical protein
MNAESISNVSLETERQIHQILANNRIEDLHKFLNKRRNLNRGNQILNYLFYLIQSSSIVLTSIGQAYSNSYCIWTGVCLSSFSGVVHYWELTNTKISKVLLQNIKAIKDNKYIDEIVFDLGEEKEEKERKKSYSNLINTNNSGNSSII